MERNIAVYNCDGELLQWIDQKRFRRLVDVGRVARVVKTRTGRIRRIKLVQMPGEWKPSLLSGMRAANDRTIRTSRIVARPSTTPSAPLPQKSPICIGAPILRATENLKMPCDRARMHMGYHSSRSAGNHVDSAFRVQPPIRSPVESEK
jgi:hypothetical protein